MEENPPTLQPVAPQDESQKIQAEIDATVDLMRGNIAKVAERGERLDNLQDKTG